MPCRSVVFHSLGVSADVAVLSFALFPSAKVNIAWQLQTRPDVAGVPFNVLSHPDGGGLASSGACTSLPHLHNFGAGGLSGSEFAHDCDTTGGSSGAAILDAASGDLVGIQSGRVSVGGASYNVATFARVMKGGVLFP